MRYELMVDARGPEGIVAVERTPESLREIPVDRDQHLERLGDHLGVTSQWISEPS